MIEVIPLRTHMLRLLKTAVLGLAVYAVGAFILVYVAAEGEL